MNYGGILRQIVSIVSLGVKNQIECIHYYKEMEALSGNIRNAVEKVENKKWNI